MISAATVGNTVVDILSVYRPPDTSLPLFLDEFADLIETLVASKIPSLVFGDFYVHMDTNNSNANSFEKFIMSLNLKQHVNFPTHDHGHKQTNIIIKEADKVGAIVIMGKDYYEQKITRTGAGGNQILDQTISTFQIISTQINQSEHSI